MGERKRVERFEDLIGSVERVIMTRATKVKGLPINREPFAKFFHSFSDRGTGRPRGPKDRHSDSTAPSALMVVKPNFPGLTGRGYVLSALWAFPFFFLGQRALSESQLATEVLAPSWKM